MSRKRKPVFQDYYTGNDYEDIMKQLPEIIEEASRRAGEILEPTVHEKTEVMGVIRDFIRDRKRKVYGGTAINEAIKIRNPEDAIYDDYNFSDIEFYSPTPKKDVVDLTNILYEKGYKCPYGREANHEETFTIIVNFQLYCDISYVPTRVYNGIKTIVIDGIHYVDPHFILIDQLRILNQPLTAAAFRWEKTFKRMYRLLKNYPLEYFDKTIQMDRPDNTIKQLINEIKNQFLANSPHGEKCLISGYDAYNFYIRHAQQDRNVEQMARTTYGADRINTFTTIVPYLDLISVDYHDSVENMYYYLRNTVPDSSKLSLREFHPLFQFVGHSVFIDYDGKPLVRITDSTGFCVPNIRTTRGYMYVSYQYILMVMLINKFRSYLDSDQQTYYNYSVAVSNLVSARNNYLNSRKLGVINNTVFGEFRVSCVGETFDFMHSSRKRQRDQRQKGKKSFYYSPTEFFAQSQEIQDRFDPLRQSFKNASGNPITNPKKLMFRLNDNGEFIVPSTEEESEDNEENEENEDDSNSDDSSSD